MNTPMTAKKASPIGSLVVVVGLAGSLLLNFYLLRPASDAEAADSPKLAAKSNSSAAATARAAKPLTTAAIITEADLETLRDTLFAAGASENRVREVIWGTLRWRFRDEQSKKRLDRIARGWWKDEQRAMGITRSRQWLVDDPAMLRDLVDNKMVTVMGPDPTEVAVAKA